MSEASCLDRRSLLQLCASAGLALALPPWPGPAAASKQQTTLVLADQRYAESLRFAASLERGGAKILPLGRDLARLWSQAIEPRLPSKLGAMAGLTLASDLFGIERLAEGSGASTVFAQKLVLEHAPRRGSPRYFVSWLIAWSSVQAVG
jgi:hypothetical protein